jgi:hypothetical protein
MMAARFGFWVTVALLGAAPLGALAEAAATTEAVSASPAAAPVVTAVPLREPAATPAVAGAPSDMDALLHPQEYDYHGGGRDPFSPLVGTGGEEESTPVVTDPGVADLVIVGLLWGGGMRFALAETPHGMGLVLRVGDRVRDGVVTAIGVEGVAFSQTAYGLTRRVTLPIGLTEEGRHER